MEGIKKANECKNNAIEYLKCDNCHERVLKKILTARGIVRGIDVYSLYVICPSCNNNISIG